MSEEMGSVVPTSPSAMAVSARRDTLEGPTEQEYKIQVKDSTQKKPDEEYSKVGSWQIWKMTAADWPYTLLGFAGALGAGCAMPLFALIFGSMSSVFYDPNPVQQSKDAAQWALIFFALGVGVLLASLSQEFGFSTVGQRLTFKLRQMLFLSLARSEVAWFDGPNHNSRILSSILATEASLVEGGTTKVAGMTLQILTTLAVGLFISFYYSWKVALVVLACGPVLVATGSIRMKVMTGFTAKGQKAFEGAAKLSGEAIGNIKTVHAFNAEERMVKEFDLLLKPPMKVGTKKAHISGLAFGLSQLFTFCCHALTWWFAATLVASGELSFGSMMKSVFAIFMAATGVGFIFSMMPDMQAAALARNKVIAMIERKSFANPLSQAGNKEPFSKGLIEFEDVRFAYPLAPDVPVLRGLSLRVEPGQTLALVGTSGSGKSTVVSLLLRFYEISTNPACSDAGPLPFNELNGGRIHIDGQDISLMNLEALRSQIGIVSQEPTLFDATIAENIRVGKFNATQEEVEAAARAANVHEFIDSLPLKYETEVGVRGTQLSGGQKQRIAIARALIRNPKVLLLDEATSALDAESEKIVQEALDKLMATKERTIVMIAHRLSTVRHADKIAVLTKGKLREIGKHEELMALNGIYAELVKLSH